MENLYEESMKEINSTFDKNFLKFKETYIDRLPDMIMHATKNYDYPVYIKINKYNLTNNKSNRAMYDIACYNGKDIKKEIIKKIGNEFKVDIEFFHAYEYVVINIKWKSEERVKLERLLRNLFNK